MTQSDKRIYPVILSGGSGTRLWPLSRSMRPKQFINLVGSESLFQLTLKRISGLANCNAPIIVCNEDHRFLVAEQLRELGITQDSILLEPVGRNTAPAIAAAACKLAIINEDPEALLLVLPADHLIASNEHFHQAVESAVESAEQGNLVTFGIEPTFAATGYGYIKAKIGKSQSPVPVEAFIEKPDEERAREFIQSGDYCWNSGMFLFRADQYLRSLAATDKNMVDCIRQSVKDATADLDFLRLEPHHYAQCRHVSIDYAVMETANNVSVSRLGTGWSDIGSWSALWEHGEKDEHGNVTAGDVFTLNSKNCYIHSENRLVTAHGVENLIIIETHDGIMVSDLRDDQSVKQLVSALQDANRPEAELHRKAYRPWGNYDSLDRGHRFQVKRITVKSGEATSMQKHFHRAEHWIVVSGTAEVTVENDVFTLTENESGYIPLGAKHRLRNPGIVPLELIEVQTGAYLGEDDIERFDDEYGRS